MRVLRSRVFVALHMHAGDGNVHTNIPVNSDDYAMLQEANAAVARIMALARALGGVDLGRARHRDHQARIPDRRTSSRPSPPTSSESTRRAGSTGQAHARGARSRDDAYTPSFALIGHESLILEPRAIGRIADSIKDCLRCGKCKPVCATHVPRANLLYRPRNKILATSLLTEAFLYEEQTRRGVSLAPLRRVRRRRRPLHRLPQVRDPARSTSTSATSRSPCATCCARGRQPFSPARRRRCCSSTRRTRDDQVPSGAMIDCGYRAQRLAPTPRARASGLAQAQTQRPPRDRRRAAAQGAGDPLHQQADAGRAAEAHGARAARHRGRRDRADHPRPGEGAEDSEAVFYFPGCGSERLFSQVGLATQAMLYHVGAQTVLPPGYLCCGYPQTSAGEADKGSRSSPTTACCSIASPTRSTTSTSRPSSSPAEPAWTSCRNTNSAKIFPGCRLLDIHEYLLEKGVKLEGIEGVRYMYHDPCHTPMKTYAPLEVVNELMGAPVALNERCCGESGTLATTRPDISTQVRFRKEEEMRKGAARCAPTASPARSRFSRPALRACRACRASTTTRHDGRLHRGRDGAASARPGLDGRVRRQREPRRHRARSRLRARTTVSCYNSATAPSSSRRSPAISPRCSAHRWPIDGRPAQ